MPLVEALYLDDGDIPFEQAKVERALVLLIASPDWGRVFVSESAGRAVGYAVTGIGFSLEFGGRDAFVDELFVVPDMRSRGVGSALIDCVLTFCMGVGVRALHLEVGRANTGAQKLYRRLGFVDHDRYLMTRALSRGRTPRQD